MIDSNLLTSLLGPEGAKGLLSLGGNTGENPFGVNLNGGNKPSIWDELSDSDLLNKDVGQIGSKKDPAPVMPSPPGGASYPDVSGFANYGMTAPDPGDPIKIMSGLMAMVRGSERKKTERSPVKRGGLMSYLETLGV